MTMYTQSLGDVAACTDPVSGDSFVCPPGTTCDPGGSGNCVSISNTGSGALPCVSGSGPLQQGQVYCMNTNPAAGPQPVYTPPLSINWWLVAAAGLVVLIPLMGGKR